MDVTPCPWGATPTGARVDVRQGSRHGLAVIDRDGTQLDPLPLRGRFNVANAVAAVAVPGALRRRRRHRDAMHRRRGPGRLQPVEEGQRFTVLVDYAHKPDALE